MSSYRTLLLALILHPPPLEMIVLISRIPRDGTQGSALPPSLPVATRLSILGAELCPPRVGGTWGTAGCSLMARGFGVHGLLACVLWLDCQGNKGEMLFNCLKSGLGDGR